jgi:hypothetical protein
MNRIFKDNSRFASLIEEKPVNRQNKEEKEYKEKKEYKMEKTENSFKNDKPCREYSSFHKSYKERMEDNMKRLKEEEIIKKAQEEIRKEEEKKVALAIESFPELLNSKTKIIENTTNFLEKLKTNIKVDISVKSSIKEGWTELTRDKVLNSTIMTTNIKKHKNEYVKTPEDLAYDVLDHLVFLHEERKDEYISCWGQDEWDKMFTCPNYDYHYFDKLDEIYAKKYPDSEDEIENEDFEEDEYWKKY